MCSQPSRLRRVHEQADDVGMPLFLRQHPRRLAIVVDRIHVRAALKEQANRVGVTMCRRQHQHCPAKKIMVDAIYVRAV